ncbi:MULTISPECIES: DUF7155 family protein [Mycobacteriaceae]|uniref:Uncharacterized protein n=1 Tax=Mycobacterium dioxanotrophicus TaxID=482462 RepID=A0A1Y0C296_9MYCO|nr:hypothetical protein [Mycobacterium dioxanotrophicus]ART69301.1 hypothetical protein BTO20_12520 [Mycobacterium dioxanotrophicus]
MVTLISTRTRRFVAVGAFVAAAVAAPAFIATMTPQSGEVSASPACLAWFGNKDDGKCLSYSNNGNGYAPSFSIGPQGTGQNGGLTTGPLLPGQTINQGIG